MFDCLLRCFCLLPITSKYIFKYSVIKSRFLSTGAEVGSRKIRTDLDKFDQSLFRLKRQNTPWCCCNSVQWVGSRKSTVSKLILLSHWPIDSCCTAFNLLKPWTMKKWYNWMTRHEDLLEMHLLPCLWDFFWQPVLNSVLHCIKMMAH